MFLLTTNLVKNSDIYAGTLSIFLKTVLDQTKNAADAKFSRQSSS